jgi:hypothetical protein
VSKRAGILLDHSRVGKKFYPPGARSFWTEIHYAERIIPEIAWVGYFIKYHGVAQAVSHVVALLQAAHACRAPQNLEFALCSNYSQLRPDEWTIIVKRLKARDSILPCLDALTPFLRCFPDGNPMLGVDPEILSARATPADVLLTREVVGSLFDRRSKFASVVQTLITKADVLLGTYHLPDDYPYREFDLVFEGRESEDVAVIESHSRMHVNSIYQWWESRIGDRWARYFWNRGRDFNPLCAENVAALAPIDDQFHPAIKLGADFERYAWGVADEIWRHAPVDLYESEVFEVLGALLARQCTLAVKVFRNVELWDYHAGPLFLRPMTDLIITLAWILKDPLDRARKFISYGLGQEKLAIERLKAVAATKDDKTKRETEQGIAARQAWVDAQHYSFLQVVDVGSWSGISTRRMAEETGLLELYDFAYTGWSSAAHASWNYVGKFNVWPSPDPLHKHILQPALLDHGYHIDVLENATKYFEELALALVSHFQIQMPMPQPTDWLVSRLKQFEREMEELNPAGQSESAAVEQT